MNRLNFNHFYYFYVVAQLGSIKEAAERLHVSAPTISDQIRLLEEYFGCRLFHRINRSLQLTKEGKLALQYAEKSFGMATELTSRLRHQIELPKRSVDIGITLWMSQYFISETILPLFSQKGLIINVKEAQRHLLIADLEEGNLDIVFTDSEDSLSANLRAHRFGKNKTFAVADRRLITNKKPFPQSLDGAPFLNYTNESFLRYELELYFARNGITPQRIGEADDIDLHQMTVENRISFSIVPEAAKDRFCRSADVMVLGELEDLESNVYGVMKSSYRGAAYKLLRSR